MSRYESTGKCIRCEDDISAGENYRLNDQEVFCPQSCDNELKDAQSDHDDHCH